MIDIRALAYIVVESTDSSRWRLYAEQVLGAMSAPTPEGASM